MTRGVTAGISLYLTQRMWATASEEKRTAESRVSGGYGGLRQGRALMQPQGRNTGLEL